MRWKISPHFRFRLGPRFPGFSPEVTIPAPSTCSPSSPCSCSSSAPAGIWRRALPRRQARRRSSCRARACTGELAVTRKSARWRRRDRLGADVAASDAAGFRRRLGRRGRRPRPARRSLPGQSSPTAASSIHACASDSRCRNRSAGRAGTVRHRLAGIGREIRRSVRIAAEREEPPFLRDCNCASGMPESSWMMVALLASRKSRTVGEIAGVQQIGRALDQAVAGRRASAQNFRKPLRLTPPLERSVEK